MGYRFTGNTVFSDEELAEHLANSIGKELTLPHLEEAASRITRLYRDRGYLLASVYVPPQDVVDGIVTIAVVEGRYGKVELENSSTLSDSTARALLGVVRPGALIKAQTLDRAIRLLDQTPGIQARARLRAGAAANTSDLTVELSGAREISARMTLDNAGNVYVKRTRAAMAIDLENPTGLGDRLSVHWVGDGTHMSHWHVGYEAFLSAPWRWGVEIWRRRAICLGGRTTMTPSTGWWMSSDTPWAIGWCTLPDRRWSSSRTIKTDITAMRIPGSPTPK